jgi:Histidine kinase
MSRDRERQRSVDVATLAIWVVYATTYVVSFAFTGSPMPVAIRAALANALPDGFLALAALRGSRRIDTGDPAAPRLIHRYALHGVVLVSLAAPVKSVLIWIDMVLVEGLPYQLTGIVAWHFFLSALIYVTVSAISHAWLIAGRLRQEEAHAVRADGLRARAEIAALRAQINPHFLFNTLHSVLGLVRRDPAQAEAALEKLGDLMRYATQVHRNGVDFVALRQERDFVETYLDLESIRLGDRLRVVRRLDEAALDQQVPTFSLQPLVENAVRHGVAPRAEGGEISIAARLESDGLQLWLEVVNDAVGRAPEADEGGMGLRVLRERLDALYHGAAGITAGPTAAGGYSVVIRLPLSVRE